MGAAYGAAGERCMALSVVVTVGDETADKPIRKLRPQIDAMKVGPVIIEEGENDMRPVISAQHKKKIEDYIQSGVEPGATPLADGRQWTIPGHETGFFVGPTLFDNVSPEMTLYQEEIFGPLDVHGNDGVRFYTRMKTVTSTWPASVRLEQHSSSFSMPTLGE